MGTERKSAEITSFTVDQDASGIVEMPGITKLLNRKKLGISARSDITSQPPESLPKAPPPFNPPHPPEIRVGEPQSSPVVTNGLSIQLESVSIPATPSGMISLSLSLEPPTLTQSTAHAPQPPDSISLSTQSTARPTIKRRSHAVATVPLAEWDAQKLTSMGDPLAQALLQLIQGGVQSSVFLSAQKENSNNQQLIFKATAQYQAGFHLHFWQGLQWSPAMVPELWNTLLQSGSVELSPSGAVTQLKSNRNVVRSSFGVLNSEWLTLIRVGNQNALRGILAGVSSQSIAASCQSVRALLETQVPKPQSHAT